MTTEQAMLRLKTQVAQHWGSNPDLVSFTPIPTELTYRQIEPAQVTATTRTDHHRGSMPLPGVLARTPRQ